MKDLSKLVNHHVCRPDIGLAGSEELVVLVFEHLDLATNQGRGTTLGLSLPTEDAMLLLRLLQHIQRKFDLPVPGGEIADLSGTKPN